MQIEGDFYFSVKKPKNYFYRTLYKNFLINPHYLYNEIYRGIPITFTIDRFDKFEFYDDKCELHLSLLIDKESNERSIFDFIRDFINFTLFFNVRELKLLSIDNLKIKNDKDHQNLDQNIILQSLEQINKNNPINFNQKIGKNRKITIINEEND